VSVLQYLIFFLFGSLLLGSIFLPPTSFPCWSSSQGTQSWSLVSFSSFTCLSGRRGSPGPISDSFHASRTPWIFVLRAEVSTRIPFSWASAARVSSLDLHSPRTVSRSQIRGVFGLAPGNFFSRSAPKCSLPARCSCFLRLWVQILPRCRSHSGFFRSHPSVSVARLPLPELSSVVLVRVRAPGLSRHRQQFSSARFGFCWAPSNFVCICRGWFFTPGIFGLCRVLAGLALLPLGLVYRFSFGSARASSRMLFSACAVIQIFVGKSRY
jgi:hypothetical protein